MSVYATNLNSVSEQLMSSGWMVSTARVMTRIGVNISACLRPGSNTQGHAAGGFPKRGEEISTSTMSTQF